VDLVDGYSVTYIKNIDDSIPLFGTAVNISSVQPSLQWMTVMLLSPPDGSDDQLRVDSTFTDPQLTIGTSEDVPNLLYFTGIASVELYLTALQSVVYRNTKSVPTQSNRTLLIMIFDGTGYGSVTVTSLNVVIHNLPPMVTVSGGEDTYNNRFFPNQPAVSAVSPTLAAILDSNSPHIANTTLQILNALDAPSEQLTVTYRSPERITTIVREVININLPFGVLFGGSVVQSVSSIISVVNVTGLVGNVDVIVDIRHSWVGDLQLELEHGGRRELLVLHPGGVDCGKDDLFRTTFDSDLSRDVKLSKSPRTPGLCQFRMQGVFDADGDLSEYLGYPVEGDWILHVTDLLAERDNGRLVSWGLVIHLQEPHLLVSTPAVVPSLPITEMFPKEQRHTREVTSDGRITQVTVGVQLSIPYTAQQLYLPTILLEHPDGTRVVLSQSSNEFCAYGNYTSVIFDDLTVDSVDYSCHQLFGVALNDTKTSGMGSGSGSGSGVESGMGSGGIFGVDSSSRFYIPTFGEILNTNSTIPVKHSLFDVLLPANPLSVLNGKFPSGQWSVIISGASEYGLSLVGWSLRISREPNIDWVFDPNWTKLTLTGTDSVQNYNKLLRSVVYHNGAMQPDFSENRIIQVVVSDGMATSATTAASQSVLTVHHIEVDLDPLNTTIAMSPDYQVTFTEAMSAISVVDEDNAILHDPQFGSSNYTLTITLLGYQNIGEEGITVNLTTLPHLDQLITENTNSYTIKIFSVESQPSSAYQAAMRTTEYYNNAEELLGSNRSIVFQAQDAQGDHFLSTLATSFIHLVVTNDPPVLILNTNMSSEEFSNFVDYEEGQGAQLLTNSSYLLLYDNDDRYLEYVTVTILNSLDGRNEVLMASSYGTSNFIVVTYNESLNQLTLSGRDTIDNYTDVIATVAYSNNVHSPGFPSTEPRIISFIPNDGTDDGEPALVKLTFASINDPPFLDLNGMESGRDYSTVFYEERSSVLIVSPNLTVSDIDNATLHSAEVSVTNLLDDDYEVLSVMSQLIITELLGDDVTSLTTIRPTVHCNSRPLTPSDQTVVYCHGGTLTISGLDSVADYQLVLRTVSYNNLADEPNPSPRLIQFLLSDGLLNSHPVHSRVSIELINDSPFFNTSAKLPNPLITEDYMDTEGLSVDEIVSAIILDDDGVIEGLGVAIVMVDATQGQWQYKADVTNEMNSDSSGSGYTDNYTGWQNILINVTLYNALLLDTSYRIRYVPDKDTNGNITISLVAWDGSNGLPSRTLTDALSTSNIDAYSNTSVELTWTVEAVNDAPVLVPVTINLSSIDEDDYNSVGDPVVSLLEYASDVDYDLLGVAVIGQNLSNGEWQFSINGGIMWQPFGNVSASKAVVLSGVHGDQNQIRFVPDKDFNGVTSMEFVIWDLTSREDPGTRDVDTTTANPTIGAFSVNASKAVLIIDPVNDSPLVSPGMTLHTIMEDTPIGVNHGTLVADIVADYYIDVDVAAVTGIAVIGVDNHYGNWQYACDGIFPFNWTTFIGDVQFNEVFPLLPQLQEATLLLADCRIRYLPEANFNTELDYRGYTRPPSHTPYINVLGWDTTVLPASLSSSYGRDVSYHSDSITNDLSPVSQLVHINITSVNDLPLIVTNSLFTTFIEDSPPVNIVGDDLVVIDVDNERLMEVTVTIYGSFVALSDDNGGSGSGIGFGIGSGSGIGFGIGSGSGLGSGSGFGSGSGLGSGSETGSRIMSRGRRAVEDDLLRYCSGGEQRIEQLLFDLSGTDLVLDVVSLCPYMVRILPNMSVGADAPASQFEKVLQTSRYGNTIEEPQGGTREISFIITDVEGGYTTLNSTVIVQLVNDLPMLDLNSHIPDLNNFVQYTEGQGPLLLTNSTAVTLTDHDNVVMQSAKVTIAQAPDADHEVLLADTSGSSINSYYNDTSFTLHLMGADSIENYTMVLSTVTYDNTYAHPGNPDESQREVVFLVSDGMDYSLVATSYISFTGVNNKPMLDVNGNAAGVDYVTVFIEEGVAIPVVDSLVIIHDEDNQTLEYLTVEITNLLDDELEMLAIDSDFLQSLEISGYPSILEFVVYNATSVYNASSAVLTLVGFPTVEEFQIVLSSVRYINMADEPDPTTRVLQITAYDGNLLSDVVNTTVSIELLNDSPRFIQGMPIIEPSILEDEGDNQGINVQQLAYNLIEDDDVVHERGVAIVSVDSVNGEWQYQVANNDSWLSIPSDTSYTTARLLRATSDNRIRFVPDLNFHGTTNFTFVAWDASDGLSDGTTRAAVSGFVRDAFSKTSRTLLLRVIAVNDAPVLNTSVVPEMSAILEDSVLEWPSEGDDVTLFLSALQQDVDHVTPLLSKFGIAVVGVDTSNGRWQVTTNGGAVWSDVRNPTSSSAVVLRNQPTGANRIRYFPNRDYNGMASFTFKIWDLNSTQLSGTTNVDTDTDPIVGSFSVEETMATVVIEPVNDSPVLNGGNPLPPITEDVSTLNNLGVPIGQIVRGFYTDVDEGNDIGVAIVEVDTRFGVWEYTCDTGSNVQWNPFTGGQLFQEVILNLPHLERATLLRDICYIRFIPNDCYNTEFDQDNVPRPQSDLPYIMFRGWDNTQGANQMTGVDTTTFPDDHLNAFSENISMVTIQVTSVNDLPVLQLGEDASDFATVFTEPLPPARVVTPVSIVDPSHLSLTDCDHAHMQFLTVTFVRFDDTDEELLVDTSNTGLNYSIIFNAPNTYMLRIEADDTGDLSTVEEYVRVLRTLQYQNQAEEPNSMDRIFTFSVFDGVGFSHQVMTQLSIALVNDPAQFDLNTSRPDLHSRVMYSEGQGEVPLAIMDTFSLVDHDNTSLYYISVTIREAPNMEQEILDANVTGTTITKQYNNNNSELLLIGPATVDEFISVLATVTYNNTFANPGNPSGSSREIEFIVNDGLNDSIPAVVYLSFMLVNNRPFVDVSGDMPGVNYTVMFYEERGPVMVTDPTAIIEDIDNTSLEYVQVVISPLLDGDYEILTVSSEVERIIGDIDGDFYSVEVYRPQWNYNSSTATLTITGLDTVLAYQEVLKTVTYDNMADEPNDAVREIVFTAFDGLLASRNVTTVIITVKINDSPYLNLSAPLRDLVINEDEPLVNNTGWSLEYIADHLILDDDDDAIKGVAIVGIDSSAGEWQYSTSGPDGVWTPFNANASISIATVLRINSSYSSIRLLPAMDYNGQALFSFKAWDVSDGYEDGAVVDATSLSAIDAFSSDFIDTMVTVLRVNDAPVLMSAPYYLSTVMEDEQNPPGDLVFDLTANVSDVDVFDLSHGVAIVMLDQVNGVWQFSVDDGNTWVSILEVGVDNATLLNSSALIRFLPSQNFNSFVTLTYLAWDLTSGEPSGTMGVDTTLANAITGSFSVNTSTATLYVEPVNDSPVLSGDTTLTTILEDMLPAENTGTLVSDIVRTVYYDVDINHSVGVAVIGVDLRYGVWEWRCPQSVAGSGSGVFSGDASGNYGEWHAFIGNIVYGFIIPANPLPERATLLSDDCSIRFLPNLNYNTLRDTNGDLWPPVDMPHITLVGWDDTGLTHGLSGQYGVDTTYNAVSNLNEFSSASHIATIIVTSVNDLPEVSISPDGTSYSTEFVEDMEHVRIVDPLFVTIIDDDHAWLDSVTITVTNTIDPGVESIGLVPLANSGVTLLANNTVAEVNTSVTIERVQLIYHVYSSGPGSNQSSLTLRAPPGEPPVTVEAYQIILQQAVYKNRHPELTNDTRVIEFDVYDSEDSSFVYTNVTIILRAENAPVLIDEFSFATFTENQPSPVGIAAANLSLTDQDHNEFFFIANATLKIQPVYDPFYEYVSVNFTEVRSHNFNYTFNETRGCLVIVGVAPVDIYQSLLRTSFYYNDQEEPSPGRRFISMFVTDAHGLSSNTAMTEVQLVVINDRVPIITTQGTRFVYTEHGQAIDIARNLTITDEDSGDFPQFNATVLLTNPLDITNEYLNITVLDNVTLEEDNFTLTFVGPASLSTFQSILQTLSYINTAEEPITGRRTVELQINDGDFTSEVVKVEIDIGLVNDLPELDLNGPNIIDRNIMVNYVEGAGPSLIINSLSLTVRDNDHMTLDNVTITLTNPLDGPSEVLDVIIPAGVGINKSYDNDTGVLLLLGEASLLNYQQVLRTTTYNNMEALPGRPSTDQRLITFLPHDGENYGTAVNATITFESVNDPPILDLNGDAMGVNYETTFTEEGTPIFITTTDMLLYDVDSENLSYAVITIENYLDHGMELLAVDEDVLILYLFATFSYTNGVFNITGQMSPEEYTGIVRNVTYQNIADEPDYTPRLITIIVNDGLNNSIVYNTTVTIVPVNDPPRLFIAGYVPPPTTEPPTSVMGSGIGMGSGVDTGIGSGVDAGMGSGVNTGMGSGLDSGMGSGTGSGSDIGSGMDSNTGSGMEAGDGMTSGSGTEPDMASPGSRRRRAVSEEVATSQYNYITSYMENEVAVLIVDPPSVAVEDDDDITLPRLQVTITNVLDEMFEAVFFDSTILEPSLIPLLGPYAIPFCPYDGDRYPEINLMSNLTLNQWANVIKTLKYCNTDEKATNGTRAIEIFIEDHQGARSPVRTTLVNVSVLNDEPVLLINDTVFLYTIDEDHNITFPVLEFLTDPEEILDSSGVEIFQQPDQGIALVDNNDTGNITYFPQQDDYGNRTFRFRVCDSEGDCSRPVVVTIIVNPINDPPYPIPPLLIELEEDTTVTYNATMFFGDVEDDLIPGSPYPRVTRATTPAGTWELTSGDIQRITYTPLINSDDPDGVTINVVDSDNLTTTIEIRIIVIPVNDLPVIIPHYPEGMSCFPVAEDTPTLLPISVTDVEDREELEVGVAAVLYGSATPNHTHYSAGPRPETIGENTFTIWEQRLDILYSPQLNYHGPANITVTAADTDNGTVSIDLCVMVDYDNDAPIFGITMVTIDEDEVLQLMLPGELNVTDAENILNAGSFSIVELPSVGELTYTFNSTENDSYPAVGTLMYIPPQHYFTNPGEFVTFILMACDNDQAGDPLCTNKTIYISITSVNDAPILPLVSRVMDEDSSITFNLSMEVSDVEEGSPPIENISLIEPPPQYGSASYDKSTGLLTYTPQLNFFGVDEVHYESCDALSHCNQHGVVRVTVQNVNDRPDSINFTHVAREDDFDLITMYTRVSDNETLESDIISSLRISLIDPVTREYLNEWKTSVGGNLRVYHAHGIVTYEPPFDFVGQDSFIYAVCDVCDEDRNRELGRVVLEPECVRQLEENGGSRYDANGVKIACSEAVATVLVTNIDDVPITRDVPVTTQANSVTIIDLFGDSRVEQPANSQHYFYSDISAAVYDPDDRQALEANDSGLDLNTYNLALASDINQTSLVLRREPGNGMAEIRLEGNRSVVLYTPTPNFQGYDSFLYEVCDLPEPPNTPQCSSSTINVFITGIPPLISSVEVIAYRVNNFDTDAKLSRGDTVRVTFDQDTNTPPFGRTVGQTLTQEDIDGLFEFDAPFLLPEIVGSRYTGMWINDRVLDITIVDEGYPQPSPKVGEWMLRVKENDGPCGGFDDNAVRLAEEELNPFCLVNKARSTAHSVSVSPPLEGNFGRKPPSLSNIVIRNSAVDQITIDANPDSELFDGSFVVLLYEPPFSYNQLDMYCESSPNQMIDAKVFGDTAVVNIEGCANLLSDAQDANQVYQDTITLAEQLWTAQRGKREADGQHKIVQRQAFDIANLTNLPVVSEVVLSLQNPKPIYDPSQQQSEFVDSVTAAINKTLIAKVIEATTGVRVTVTLGYFSTLPITELPDTEVYQEHRPDLTPQVEIVVASDPDNGDTVYGRGDAFTITFDRDTDTPPVSTKEDIDRIFVFTPPLGRLYSGRWRSATVLEIIVDEPNDPAEGIPTVGGSFLLQFRPNTLTDSSTVGATNTGLPTGQPHCIGINVCGTPPSSFTDYTVGVCSMNGESCRANDVHTNLEGDFGIPQSETAGFPFVIIIVVVLVVVGVAVVAVLVFAAYRHHKKRKERKETARIIRRWEKDQAGKGTKDEVRDWARPPEVAAMRDNPDPFQTPKDMLSSSQRDPFGALPTLATRPPTALSAGLPPVPSFMPRADPQISSSMGRAAVPFSRQTTTSSLGPLVSVSHV